MKRSFLEELGLEKDVIDKIMKENGNDINTTKENEKAKYDKLQEKYNALESENNSNKQMLDEANSKIQSFKEIDVEKIKAEADDWKSKYETSQAESKKAQEEFEQKMKDRDYSDAVNKFFGDYKFIDDDVKETVIGKFKAKEFKLDGDRFLGGEDFMKEYMEQHKSLFVQEEEKKDEEQKNQDQNDWKPPTFTNINGMNGETKPTGNSFGFNFVGVRARPEK